MIHVDLSVDPHHKVRPPHTILEKVFETWDEVIAFLNPLGFNFMSQDKSDQIFPMLLEFKKANEYVQVEIELKDVTGTTYTAACLSIEGREESRVNGYEVYVLTTFGKTGGILDQELFDTKPTFQLNPNQHLRVGNVNGGDSIPVKEATYGVGWPE